jgi:hypothetical protein
VVGHNLVGDPVQPRTFALTFRHLGKAAPGDEEGVGGCIGGFREGRRRPQ